MKTRRLCLVLATTSLALPALHAQRPVTNPTGDQPWPKVAMQAFAKTEGIIPGINVDPVSGQANRPPSAGTNGNSEAGDFITDIVNAGDGTNRLFLVERVGGIWILNPDGTINKDPFLDMRGYPSIQRERGLMSAAFPPDFKTKKQFYIGFTWPGTGNLTLARVTVDANNPNHADAKTGDVLMSIPHNDQDHICDTLAFGKDGMLYWSLGDGGSDDGPDGRHWAQDLGKLYGKILRIDVSSPPDPGLKYHIPTDNPFVKTAGARGEIWDLGLRNPWRFSFDQKTGDLYIANVGEDEWEMIYFVEGNKGGQNFGWSLYEGTHKFTPTANALRKGAGDPDKATGPVVNGTPDRSITEPVAEFSHGTARVTPARDQWHAIIGGYVYRSAENPSWDGVYFFSDWSNARYYGLRRNANGQWESHQVDDDSGVPRGPVTFGQDEKGNVYVVGFAENTIYKLVARKDDATPAPAAAAAPAP